jgi:uncharacterized protein YijF (DUF1287 family)
VITEEDSNLEVFWKKKIKVNQTSDYKTGELVTWMISLKNCPHIEL